MAKRKEKSTPPGPSRHQRFKKWTRWLWTLYILGILLISLTIFSFTFMDLPGFDELENPEIDYATVVYDRNGEDLGKYFLENRVAIPFDDLNPHLVNALVATEDVRYYSHSGIDFWALMRVGVKTVILQQKSAGGGSTLTQQLAKQLYSGRNFKDVGPIGFYFRLLYYKMKEWLTAVRLERSYTKEEILAMYLNEYDFIYGAHGVEAAAQTYFGKSQSELKIEEAAMLVGMLKNAVLYNPLKYEDNALSRRNVVLAQMHRNEVLDKDTKDSLQQLEVDVTSFERSSHLTGPATYFRASLKEWLKDMIRERQLKKSDGRLYNVDRDGLRIYTTIDRSMQDILESSVRKHMPDLQEKFFKHWENKDIWTYKYDNIPEDIKLSVLEKQIRNTDRYRSISAKLFIKTASMIEGKYGFTFHDYDMDRLLKAEEDKDYLDRLRANRLVSKEKAQKYKKLLKSEDWATLKADWNAFQEEVDRQFGEKVPMTVFAYNSEGEKDTVMTPLDSLKYHRMILQVGSLAIDPRNGEVRAWVGGPDHRFFKYDHVTSNRQVGSTFKPFLYATAISFQGFSPCFPVTDVKYTIEPEEGNFGLLKPWEPKNSNDEYSNENITLYEALKQSKNTVSVFLMKQLGDTRPLLGLVNNMGIDSAAVLSNGRYKIPRQPSIALGSADLTVMEMTSAYTTFANEGRYQKPYFVTRVEDRNGKILYQSVPETKVALNKDVNYVMVEMLRYSGNVAKYKGSLKSDVGGKTGTTNDQTDAWYVGISPNVVVGTWVGGEDRWIRFRSIALGQGSRMARPIYTEFMKQLEARADELPDIDISQRFKEPEDMNIETDCDQYDNSKGDEEGDRNFDFF